MKNKTCQPVFWSLSSSSQCRNLDRSSRIQWQCPQEVRHSYRSLLNPAQPFIFSPKSHHRHGSGPVVWQLAFRRPFESTTHTTLKWDKQCFGDSISTIRNHGSILPNAPVHTSLPKAARKPHGTELVIVSQKDRNAVTNTVHCSCVFSSGNITMSMDGHAFLFNVGSFWTSHNVPNGWVRRAWFGFKCKWKSTNITPVL